MASPLKFTRIQPALIGMLFLTVLTLVPERARAMACHTNTPGSQRPTTDSGWTERL